MKKLLCSIAIALLVSLLCVSALAVPSSATYSTTREFLKECDEQEIRYTYDGIDQDNDEKVKVSINLTDTSITEIFYFSEDNEDASIRVWNFIDFAPSDYNNVLEAVNSLNAQYRWVRFYIDKSDNSVTCAIDVEYSVANTGEVTFMLMRHMMNICDYAYSELSRYDIG